MLETILSNETGPPMCHGNGEGTISRIPECACALAVDDSTQYAEHCRTVARAQSKSKTFGFPMQKRKRKTIQRNWSLDCGGNAIRVKEWHHATAEPLSCLSVRARSALTHVCWNSILNGRLLTLSNRPVHRTCPTSLG